MLRSLVGSEMCIRDSLDVSTYSRRTASIKEAYEKGYGVAIGACSSPCSSYDSGVAITSTAAASRRSASVTYTTTLTGLSSSEASAYTSGCSGSCTTTTLASAITTVASSTGADVGTVTVSSIGSATTSSDDSTSSGTSTTVYIIIAVAAAAVLVMIVAALVYFKCKKQDPSFQEQVDIDHGSEGPGVVLKSDPTPNIPPPMYAEPIPYVHEQSVREESHPC
eukprot:TRINITY_DN25986_c0_g1_i1.p1 TRINITY_DN25986_c0_g1~~TRINITY_DN25986_c0_g1_i1.p1  ORF type:complete len:222 (+),score=43.02 TRINITY_DN25986_c0_g1_i1:139-804(+)